MRRRDWVQIINMFEGSWVQFDGRSSFRGDGNRLIRVRFVIRSQSAASSRLRSGSVDQRSHKVHEINEMSSNAQLREHTKDSHHAAFPAVPASFRRTARPPPWLRSFGRPHGDCGLACAKDNRSSSRIPKTEGIESAAGSEAQGSPCIAGCALLARVSCNMIPCSVNQ